MVKIRGIIPPIITPLCADETVNEDELRVQAELHNANKAAATSERRMSDTCDNLDSIDKVQKRLKKMNLLIETVFL